MKKSAIFPVAAILGLLLLAACISPATRQEGDRLQAEREQAQIQLVAAEEDDSPKVTELQAKVDSLNKAIEANDAKASQERVDSGVKIGAAIAQSAGGLLGILGFPFVGNALGGIAASLVSYRKEK